MQDTYLTASEVASLLKLNVETVYDLIRKEELPATKIGGQWRFDNDEIRDWFRTKGRAGNGGARNA